eukprot:TRINITY_DN3511_c0_g2_i1.p2 TRINITY_DN3511_c0_g2~~TRINITY_DN3511_c0_g2_i1.p2  ORF type:complete len:124 (-),score=13.18 TRINITY_DN3511_c0_g2_i1:166-537(-)
MCPDSNMVGTSTTEQVENAKRQIPRAVGMGFQVMRCGLGVHAVWDGKTRGNLVYVGGGTGPAEEQYGELWYCPDKDTFEYHSDCYYEFDGCNGLLYGQPRCLELDDLVWCDENMAFRTKKTES